MPEGARVTQQPNTSSSVASVWFLRLGPPLLYLAITLVFLLPLPLHLSGMVIKESPDIWIHLWWMWQVRESVLAGQNPYETFRVFHPTGAPLYLMGQDMVTALLSVPLQGALGLVATYNLLTLLAVPFGAWAMYLLALDVTGSRAGALVAGAIFGFAPLQSSLLNLGQMEYVNIGFLPLAILFLLRLRRDRRVWVPLAGAALAVLTILSSWYQGLFLFLFAAWFVAYEVIGLVWRKRWKGLRAFASQLAIYGLAALALISPVLLPTIRLAAGSRFAVTTREAVAYSALAPLEPFRPNTLNPLFGVARTNLSYSLGYVALALALIGLWRVRRRGLFWALTIVLFYSLALGPFLKLGTRQIDLPFLPYNVLYALPMGNIARVPLRFLILITLALAILAAWGVGWLAEWLPRRLPQRATLARIAVPALALFLVLAELFPVPRPLASAAIEPYYATLAEEPPGAVYELPYDDRAIAMYHATVHDHPVIGGYVSRPVPYPLLNGVPVIYHLRARADDILADLDAPDIIDQPSPAGRAVDILDTYDIRYVIVRRDATIAPDQLTALIAAVEDLLPPEAIVHDEPAFRVYRIPHAARSGIVTGIGPGWYASERRSDTGKRFRWANGDATLPITLLDDAPRTAPFTATIFSYNRPATVDIFLNDQLLTTLTVTPGEQLVALNLALQHGYNELRLRAREESISPAQVAPGSRDSRALSFALADVRIAAP
jgi:hypothetical protein